MNYNWKVIDQKKYLLGMVVNQRPRPWAAPRDGTQSPGIQEIMLFSKNNDISPFFCEQFSISFSEYSGRTSAAIKSRFSASHPALASSLSCYNTKLINQNWKVIDQKKYLSGRIVNHRPRPLAAPRQDSSFLGFKRL